MGRKKESIELLAHFPDFRLLNFFFWCTVKGMVYCRKPVIRTLLKQKIQAVCLEIPMKTLVRNAELIVTRTQKCYNVAVKHF